MSRGGALIVLGKLWQTKRKSVGIHLLLCNQDVWQQGKQVTRKVKPIRKSECMKTRHKERIIVLHLAKKITSSQVPFCVFREILEKPFYRALPCDCVWIKYYCI